VHILGIQATELIHEAAVIIKMGGTAMDMAGIVHAHPCLAETVQRAATDALNPAG
jgi:dihydrolipoamide dehydrogenase